MNYWIWLGYLWGQLQLSGLDYYESLELSCDNVRDMVLAELAHRREVRP